MPTLLIAKRARMMARIVIIAESAPAIAKVLPLKIVVIIGMRSEVPQVGQPAPRTARPVTRPAEVRASEAALKRFLLRQTTTIRPIKMARIRQIKKIGSQSRKVLLTPKRPKKALPSIPRAVEKST